MSLKSEPLNLRVLTKKELFEYHRELQLKLRKLKLDINEVGCEIDFRISLQQMKLAGM